MNTEATNVTQIYTTGPEPYACHPARSYKMLIFAFIPLCQIVINVIVIIAVVDSRRKLRHNFVYAFVINTLAANLLFGLFCLYELCNLVLAFERNWGEEDPFRARKKAWLHWWAFRMGMTDSLFIAMSGSISALIYGIRESSYFIGRTVKHRVTSTRTKLTNRRRMWVIIFFVWIIPVLLCMASAFGWSCALGCECTPAFYGEGVYPCRSDIRAKCSRILNPLTKNFVLLAVIFWLLESIGIVIMIGTTIRKYKKVMTAKSPRPSAAISSVYFPEHVAQSKKHHAESENQTSNNAVTHGNPAVDVKTSHGQMKTLPSDSRDDVFPTQEQMNNFSRVYTFKPKQSFCVKMPPLNHNIKLLLTLSSFFLLCTSPVMIIVIVDAVTPKYVLSDIGVMLPYVVCLCYSSISPLILVYYMAGLRAALMRILFRCSCYTKTVSPSVSSISD